VSCPESGQDTLEKTSAVRDTQYQSGAIKTIDTPEGVSLVVALGVSRASRPPTHIP